MILKILQAGEHTLRRKSRELTLAEIKSEKIQNLIDYMIETLRDAPGVGLAAPQVGQQLKILVVEDKKEYQKKVSKDLLHYQNRKSSPLRVIINPMLTIVRAEEAEHFEGCLSIGGFRAVVPRAHTVHISGLNRRGKKVSYYAEGWLARIFQHECDHLDGMLYIDTMYSKTFMSEPAYLKHWADIPLEKLKVFIADNH